MKTRFTFARLRPSGQVGAAIVALVILLALIATVWTPFDPTHALPEERLAGPSLRHLLGTDRFGRDVFSRIMAGSQITLLVGVVAVTIAAIGGIPLGLIAAFRRGLADSLIMRGSDVLLAFPALLLAIIFAAVFGASTLSAMVAIGVSGIPAFARVTRTNAQVVLAQDYIAAARLARRGSWWIATRHVLPNLAGLLIVQATVLFALAILAEAGLSFLGLGTPPPDPSWGRMLEAAQASLGSAPLQALWPGLAIAITVLGFNLLGDALRDLADPKGVQ